MNYWTQKDIGKSQNHYAEQKDSNAKEHILYDSMHTTSRTGKPIYGGRN